MLMEKLRDAMTTLNVANYCVESFQKDACITIEGEKNADRFFIVREGKVRLRRDVSVANEPAGGTIGPGDVFGIVSVMSGRGEYLETARAQSDTAEIVSVRRDQFCQFIKDNAAAAVIIMLQFSERMRSLNDALAGGAANTDRTTQTDAAPPQVKTGASHYEIKTDDPTRIFPAGAKIFSEGDAGEEVFIIKRGSVKITKQKQGGEVLLAMLAAGNIFGEMALLGSAPRTASVAAAEECELVVLNREKFMKMIRSQPQMVERLIAQLADRVWLLNKQLANALISDPINRMFDMLLVNLENVRANLNSAQAHRFDFGVRELIDMCGLSQDNIVAYTEKLKQNRYVVITPHGTITIQNICEFAAQASYCRKAQKVLDKVRQEMI